MMVLSRKVGEEIVIGDKIHIAVVAIEGDQVRIGISAPKDVVVDRQEVHEKRKNSFSEGPALPQTPTHVIDTTPL
jgi:carbon storage regulator